MQQTKWIDREFTFESSVGNLPSILERLRGTSVRIKQISLMLSDEEAKQKPNNAWSIKEHIGHLSDLESLHEGRIDDFLARKETLRPADLTNAETNNADHNSEDIQYLINGFDKKRHSFVSRLEELDKETHQFKSLHPRLQVLILPVDLAYFVAEHDDHHLASMRALCKHMNKYRPGRTNQ